MALAKTCVDLPSLFPLSLTRRGARPGLNRFNGVLHEESSRLSKTATTFGDILTRDSILITITFIIFIPRTFEAVNLFVILVSDFQISAHSSTFYSKLKCCVFVLFFLIHVAGASKNVNVVEISV